MAGERGRGGGRPPAGRILPAARGGNAGTVRTGSGESSGDAWLRHTVTQLWQITSLCRSFLPFIVCRSARCGWIHWCWSHTAPGCAQHPHRWSQGCRPLPGHWHSPATPWSLAPPAPLSGAGQGARCGDPQAPMIAPAAWDGMRATSHSVKLARCFLRLSVWFSHGSHHGFLINTRYTS